MNGDLVPSRRNLRMSDADREQVLARLSSAVAEGRLTLPEFEERTDGVLRARTYGEVEPYVADLPPADVAAATEDVVELRSSAGTLARSGRWAVPARLVVRSRAGSVKLDFRHAVISHRVVEIELAAQAGSTTIVLPPGATANIDRVTTTAGTATTKVPSMPEPGSTAPHFVITGSTSAGTLLVRYEYRFWRWRW
ncbi:DUF1707 domain-containing protein [Solwaraspora sp. WMMD1047]|uniref:DUF1707 SHOCT-like domain-containing protein n=1 Tax=Solwaraspora sp. WMMD1047 TaxID=3016102 RepID=UPI002415E62B|nr:DUF1707 domain-containing protein [Solwaraspora sp. WMMD1047]MDG4828757.1 DUF1707 domain-containing protein [Solwaraspora sp. WMMD1047]